MLDRLLATGYLDGAIVLAGSDFTLHENVCALAETEELVGQSPARRQQRCAIAFCFSTRLVSSFQERVVATENLITGVSFANCLVSAFLPMYPMIVS
jgi:hypothetical protein